jgi:AcrR family transcriptional regulator
MIQRTVASPAAPLRDRIVIEARRLTIQQGWSEVTMQRLAGVVGVSRQTIYNEVGNKAALAETLILGELDRFLQVVNDAFVAHPDDLVPAIRAAVEGVLKQAQDNALLHAVVSTTHGAETELLPLLTTHSGSLLSVAKGVLVERVKPYTLGIDDDELQSAVDILVRTVLSHVMQPSAAPATTAADIAWIAHRILTGR